ncbi:MAG: hydrogenase [Ignavibacteria bacterium GWF2_33_9]|nr:MAG: hydrogenase [Ignavibacteria bacterium GWF2_33_9]
MEGKNQTRQADRLIFLGLILFLIGLLIGLFIQNMANPRMALSAHLEGVMNGMFVMLLGLIWKRLILSEVLLRTTFWLVIYGTFSNITAVVVAATTGFGKMMPIAGGQDGQGAIEGLISFLLISLALCMIVVCIIVLIGFYKYMKQSRYK